MYNNIEIGLLVPGSLVHWLNAWNVLKPKENAKKQPRTKGFFLRDWKGAKKRARKRFSDE